MESKTNRSGTPLVSRVGNFDSKKSEATYSAGVPFSGLFLGFTFTSFAFYFLDSGIGRSYFSLLGLLGLFIVLFLLAANIYRSIITTVHHH